MFSEQPPHIRRTIWASHEMFKSKIQPLFRVQNMLPSFFSAVLIKNHHFDVIYQHQYQFAIFFLVSATTGFQYLFSFSSSSNTQSAISSVDWSSLLSFPSSISNFLNSASESNNFRALFGEESSFNLELSVSVVSLGGEDQLSWCLSLVGVSISIIGPSMDLNSPFILSSASNSSLILWSSSLEKINHVV